MSKLLEAKCGTCGTYDRVGVNSDDYCRYVTTRDLVRDVFPNLTTLEREVVIGSRTGYYVCNECWEAMDSDDI